MNIVVAIIAVITSIIFNSQIKKSTGSKEEFCIIMKNTCLFLAFLCFTTVIV